MPTVKSLVAHRRAASCAAHFLIVLQWIPRAFAPFFPDPRKTRYFAIPF